MLGGTFKKPLGDLQDGDVYFGNFNFTNVTAYPQHYVIIPLYDAPKGNVLFGKHSPLYYLNSVVKNKLAYLVSMQKQQYDYYWGNDKNINGADTYSKLIDYAYLAGESSNKESIAQILKYTNSDLANLVANYHNDKKSYINGRVAKADITEIDNKVIGVVKADQFMTETAYAGIASLRLKYPNEEGYTVFVQKDNFVLAMSNCWDYINQKLEVSSEDSWNTHAFFMDNLRDKRLFNSVVSCLGSDKD